MVKQQNKFSQTVWVAIDVAKRRNEVLIEHPDRTRRQRLSVLNTREAHDRLMAHLQAFERPVMIGFEATGNYHRPRVWRLLDTGFDVQLISSVALARTREALYNSWDKNDPKDAQVMLHMMKLGPTQRYYDPLQQGINDWQELSKTHEVISRAKTEALHRLQTHYLPLYFPEVDLGIPPGPSGFLSSWTGFRCLRPSLGWRRSCSSGLPGTWWGAKWPSAACSTTCTRPPASRLPCRSTRIHLRCAGIALMRVFIDDREHLVAASPDQPVLDEIYTPDMVRTQGAHPDDGMLVAI